MAQTCVGLVFARVPSCNNAVWKSVTFRIWISGCFWFIRLVILGSRQSPESTFFTVTYCNEKLVARRSVRNLMDFGDGRGCSRWSWPSLVAGLSSDRWSLACCAALSSELSSAAETAFWNTWFPVCSSEKGFAGSFVPSGLDWFISRGLSFFIPSE